MKMIKNSRLRRLNSMKILCTCGTSNISSSLSKDESHTNEPSAEKLSNISLQFQGIPSI